MPMQRRYIPSRFWNRNFWPVRTLWNNLVNCKISLVRGSWSVFLLASQGVDAWMSMNTVHRFAQEHTANKIAGLWACRNEFSPKKPRRSSAVKKMRYISCCEWIHDEVSRYCGRAPLAITQLWLYASLMKSFTYTAAFVDIFEPLLCMQLIAWNVVFLCWALHDLLMLLLV